MSHEGESLVGNATVEKTLQGGGGKKHYFKVVVRILLCNEFRKRGKEGVEEKKTMVEPGGSWGKRSERLNLITNGAELNGG